MSLLITKMKRNLNCELNHNTGQLNVSLVKDMQLQL